MADTRKSLIEVSFRVKRTNGTVIYKKEKVTIPIKINYQLGGGTNNLRLLNPYLIPLINPGEEVLSYTKKI